MLAEEIEDGRLRIEDGKLAARHRRNGQVRRLPYTFSGYSPDPRWGLNMEETPGLRSVNFIKKAYFHICLKISNLQNEFLKREGNGETKGFLGEKSRFYWGI